MDSGTHGIYGNLFMEFREKLRRKELERGRTSKIRKRDKQRVFAVEHEIN